MAKRRESSKLAAAKRKAKREGWLGELRHGLGEEADERALLAGCWFDRRRADHVIEFFDRFATLTEGAFAGQPFRLLPWQEQLLRRLYGWQRYSAEWGYAVRRFKQAYVEVPKKNGKTPLASAVGIYQLVADSYGRQINLYTAATTKKRAQDCNLHAIRQIQGNELLAASCDVRTVDGFKEIRYGQSVWRVLPATEEGADGVNGSVIADELHLWQGHVFYTALVWALASQPEGLFFGITTAGRDSESVCRQLHERTLAVNEGRQTDQSFLGLVYAADPDDDPHDEKTWRKANPSLGTTAAAPLKLSDFRADYDAAREDPITWPEWKQKRLNLWRTAEAAWIEDMGGIEAWDAGAAARGKAKGRIDCWEPLEIEQFAEQLCDLGIDTASVRDTTAAVFSFVDEEDPQVVRVWPMFWLPERRAQEVAEKAPYRRFAEAGALKLTAGDAVDFQQILDDLLEVCRTVTVRRLFFDPRFQSEWLTQQLADTIGCERVGFEQTNRNYAACCNNLERLVIERNIRHGGNQLLTWQLGHTRLTVDSRNYRRPIKQKHGDVRTIDGVAALLMALYEIDEREEAGSYYDDNEVEFI